MRVLAESWCFCNGGGKSERLKANIFCAKSSSMAKLCPSSSSSTSASSAGAGAGEVAGSGFLIHRNLLLTTHINLPSVNAAESAEIRLQNGVPATLVPHRFFITSSVLDLTIVGLDTTDGDSNNPGHQPQYLKLYSKPNIELGNTVYLLGHAEKKELTIGEGKVVIATDNLIKLSTEGFVWSPGSAGFDSQGNLAFMICDPMKIATSPNTNKSSSNSSSSSTSWKKDLPMQFGIPMPVIFDWLNQHWEGSLDDVSKPKLPLMRLVSGGHRSEHSCASFSMRQVFKATEEIEGGTPSSSSNVVLSKPRENPLGEGTSAGPQMGKDEKVISQPHLTNHLQGIPTPEIYESPKVTANLVIKKKETSPQLQLLDINFPPKLAKASPAPPTQNSMELLPGYDNNDNYQCGSRFNRVRGDPDVGSLTPARRETDSKRPGKKTLLPGSGENCLNEAPNKVEKLMQTPSTKEHKQIQNRKAAIDGGNEEAESTGSVGDIHSEVHSSCSPVGHSGVRDEYDQSSEVETLYSAETAESRNYTSPREGRFQPVGRSQSCVSYNNRWGPVNRNPTARRSSLEPQRSFMQPRKTFSQGAPTHKTMEYFSPTVSSIMKKRSDMEHRQPKPSRVRPTTVHSTSPRWNF